MLESSLTVWTILMAVSGVGSGRVLVTSEEDILSSARGAISALLEESWLPGTTLVYVSDGTIPSSSFYHVVDRTDLKYSHGMFDAAFSELNDSDLFDNLHKIKKSSSYTTLILASDELGFLSDVIEEAISNDLLNWPARLLVVSRLPPNGLRLLQEPLSAINAMVVILEEHSGRRRCDTYMYIPYSQRMVAIASWTPYSGLSYTSEYQLFPDKFRRLPDGADMVVVGQNFPPHVVVRETTSAEGKADQFSGPLITTLEMLAADVNFTYSLVQPSDGSWGYLFPNGTWNGMIGMMIRKEVDFGLGPFGITFLRAQVIDYTSLLVVDYGRILGRRGDTEVDPWSFAFPLTYLVWSAIFATLLLILLLVRLTSKMYRKDLAFQFTEISEGTYIRALLQQDIKSSSSGSWDRILLGVWMLAVLVLIKSYSTNLVSLLAVRHISEPYQSVRDMLDDPGVTSIWFANTAYMQYLAGVDSGIFHEVAEMEKNGRMKLITPSVYTQTVDEFVSRGDYVMINPLLIMKMFLTEDFMDDKGRCKFYVSRERFLPLTFCMVVPKHSPLRGPINEGIRAVVEGGLYDHWMDNAFANAKSCKNPPSKITVRASLSLNNVWGIFVVLGMGYATSILSFCLEMMTSKHLPLAQDSA